ncbi:alpha/beta fold hydrolase [Micromonospora sp. CPCC 205556]|uniref:alpha/beta fold hydrolase n=1 Tax=Micromonospora sp. CPCC 205556 TaxID=3122398 RepID=UPI002FF43E72
MRKSRQQNRAFRQLFWAVLAVLALTSTVGIETASANAAQPAGPQDKPTVVLVHGAFADSSSWSPVIDQLKDDGYPVVAVANPLRGVKSDADYTASVLKTIPGPIVLVGHSYGGQVITAAATGNQNVKALVYVAGFAPEKGDSAATLSGKFPGSTLLEALAPPAPLPGGGKDLYIRQDKFREQFAADVSEEEAKIMAATQRPVTEAAINDKLQAEPAWKSKPSWFIYGTLDKNIPAQTHAFMAQRAGAKETVSVDGASHVVMISHPQQVAKVIRDAAQS